MANSRDTILDATLEAERLHKTLKTKSRVQELSGQIDVFGSIVDQEVALIFKPLDGLLGAYLRSPSPGIIITKSTWGRVRTFTATRMSPRRASIPQSRRIFFGCKVESEQGYGALLSRLVEGSGFHLAILSVLLRPGGGDPFDLVTLAVELNEREERRRGRYSVKAVLLDRDKLGVSPQRDRRMAMKLIPEQLVDPRRASPGTVGIVPLQVDFRP